MQCRDVEEVLEQEGLAVAGSSAGARGHLLALPGLHRRS